MGIVINQSIKNLIYTYFGFGIGAINTMFLYPYIMDDNYYGLVAVLLSTSMILYPLLSVGMSNAIIRFYSRYNNQKDKNKFISFTFLFPLVVIIPLWVIVNIFENSIVNLLSDKSELIKDYILYIFLFAVFIGYFEVFYAYSKVQLKSVFGNILKEISIRAYVTILITLLYFEAITSHDFIVYLTIGYGVRMIVMAIYSIRISNFKLSFINLKQYNNVLHYSIFLVFSASVTFLVIEIDKLMVSQFIDLSNVAYYAVGGFIGIAVSVPGRAMQQILAPFVSKAIAEHNMEEINSLYKKSSINLLIVSGFIFVLIVVNVKFLYMLLPVEYVGGEYVAIIIAASKLFDMTTGINGTIITNSKYYRYELVFGTILVVLTIGLNILFIPILGALGAAVSTGLGIIVYNLIKLLFVKSKFGYYPFSNNTLVVLAEISILIIIFYFLQIVINPIITIILYSTIVSLLYIIPIFLFKPSEQIDEILNKFVLRLKR